MTLATIIFSNRAWMAPVIVGVIVLGGAVLWSWRRNPAQGWVAGACVLLKLAGIAALALCLLDPLWVGERARPGANVFESVVEYTTLSGANDLIGGTRSPL